MTVRRFHKALRCAQRFIIKALLFGVPLVLYNSCATTKCVLCDIDQGTLYNIELKENVKTELGKQKVQTFFSPVPVEVGKNRAELYVVDCDGQEPYKMQKEELELFIRKNLYRIDTSQIKHIVTTSDADYPPIMMEYSSFDDVRLCDRNRKAFKTEMRFMLGSRLTWSNEGTFFPGYDGGILYERNDFINKVLGFGPGGTNMILGAEAAFMPRIFTLDNHHSFNFGLLTGFWPVDGGLFVPLSLHPRFTFNDITNPLWGNCNAWYLFGDLGTALDAGGDIPLMADGKLTSWFGGLGAGIDLWRNKKMDLSFDLGYRFTSLGLPLNEDYRKCLEDAGLERSVTYPSRNAGQVFLRVGLTW